ncbi:hypothetical protein [Acinetobacter sp. 1125_18A]|uniref:hypothetical protein n=1 Tax=Acinetobacter sp. 1125_18A TaxID=2605959 RepID=UPI00405849C1
MKHIICYSGGHSSAITAIEVVRKFGKENVLLVNHDINSSVELEDVKRFKKEVAEYLDLKIQYVNIQNLSIESIPDQFDVVIKAKAFKVGNGSELCTSRLKTEPFIEFLKNNFPLKDCIIYYGFDANEKDRIQRRSSILSSMGYRSDFPLALWDEQCRTISQTIQIGINPPAQYGQFKHANCIGCLKAGRQHWYIVYCQRPDIFNKAKLAEEIIGYSIDSDFYLDEMEESFFLMKMLGIPQTEHIKHQTFWAMVRREGVNLPEDAKSRKPCECVI